MRLRVRASTRRQFLCLGYELFPRELQRRIALKQGGCNDAAAKTIHGSCNRIGYVHTGICISKTGICGGACVDGLHAGYFDVRGLLR